MGVRLGVQVLSVAPRSSSSQSTRSYRYTVSGTSTTVRSRKWGEGGDALETVCLSSPPLWPCASQSGLAASPSNARCCTGKKLNDGTQRTWFCDPESTSPHFHPCALVCDPPPFYLHSDTIIAYVRWCQRALLARRHLAPARLIASTGMSISAGWA